MPYVADYNMLVPYRPEMALEGLGAVPRSVLGPDGKCTAQGWSSAPQAPYRLEDLHPAFRGVAFRLIHRINELDLPFEVNRGLRSLDRQCCSIAEGGSRLKYPDSSAHTGGLALDFKGKGPVFHDNPLSMGLSKDRKTITDSVKFGMWTALGALIENEFPELEWGGNWDKKDGQRMGFDPYHVELRGYRKHLPSGRPNWKCVGGRAVPFDTPVEKAAAKVDLAAREQPASFLVPGLLLLAGGAWFLLRKKR